MGHSRLVKADAAKRYPERYRMCRGLVVDIETGLVWGTRSKPLGSSDSSGYVQIDAGCTANGRAVGAHILVWESVYGPVPQGKEINHINGVKTDNRPQNLEAVTHRDNILHAYSIGLKSNQGEHHPSHKLTDNSVREIRRLAADGVPKRVLGEKFGVSRRAVADVLLGNTWSHVQGD